MPARHDTSLIAINRQADRARLEHFGSGILVRLREHYFVLSAAHVFTSQKLWLPGKPSMPLDEAGRTFATSPFDRTPHADHLDLGYVLLNAKAVAALTALGRTFLESTEWVLALPPLKTAVVTFVGMPCSKSKTIVGRQQLITTPTYIRSSALTAAEVTALGRDAKLHLAIHYDRERLSNDATGARVTGPLPEGMSGGPMWLVLPDGTPKLWAIGTDYDLQKQVLWGSKIQPLLRNLLERHFGQPS